MDKTPGTEAMWAAYAAAAGVTGADYVVVAFGNSAAMADEIAGLVLGRRKRATASLARDYAPGGEPMPRVGDYVVVVDSAGRPRCIWRTTEIVVKPLIEVDEAFAWDEGEGDRSRDWWLAAHREYFFRQARREGFEMHDQIETVFECFKVVWPPEAADSTTWGQVASATELN